MNNINYIVFYSYYIKIILITGVIVFTILISKYLLQVSKYDKGLRNQVKQYRCCCFP